MTEFSAADAAFTGFRVVWGRPRAVLIWFALQFVVLLGLNLFSAISAGPALTAFVTSALQPNPADAAAMLARAGAIAPTLAVLAIAQVVVAAVLFAAMNRAVLKPDESRFGYLRLAGDELRQLVLLLGLIAIAFLAYVGLFVSATLVFGLLTMVTSNAGVAAALTLSFALPGALVAFVYIGVRLSLASPATFVSGAVRLPDAWRLTRGRFWPLLGTYAIALALRLVVSSLFFVIGVLVLAIASGGLEAAVGGARVEPNSLAALLTPGQVAYLVVASLGAAVSAPITLCPPASIYKAVTRAGARAFRAT